MTTAGHGLVLGCCIISQIALVACSAGVARPGGTRLTPRRFVHSSANTSYTQAGVRSMEKSSASEGKHATLVTDAHSGLHTGASACVPHTPRAFSSMSRSTARIRTSIGGSRITDHCCDADLMVTLRSSTKAEVVQKPISLQAVYTADLDWATDWRDRVLAAVVSASKLCLEKLAVSAFKHTQSLLGYFC